MLSSITQQFTDRMVEGTSSQGRVDVVSRLRSYVEESEKRPVRNDAASFEQRPETSRPITYGRVRSSEVRDIASTEIRPAERVAEKSPIFEPGKEITGFYRSGKFITGSGDRGTYEGMTGGQVSFEIGGYKGILMPNNKAVVFNAQTGESYSMNVRMANGQYKISNIQELSPTPYAPGEATPLYVEGRSENVNVRYNKESGQVGVSIPSPDGSTVTGTGYMDKNGTMILALSNGATIQAKYDFSDNGKMRIYSRSQIG